MKASVFVLGLLLLGTGNQVLAQPNLPLNTRKAVYRIAVPQIDGQATALCFKHTPSREIFLLLNKHSIARDSAFTIFCDSLKLFINRQTDDGEVISGPEAITVYLRRDTTLFLPDHELDVVLVRLSEQSIDTGITISFMRWNLLIPFDHFRKVLNIDPPGILTAIGYPGKAIASSHYRSPEYRWGFYTGHDSSALWSDIPIVRMSSGSAVFARAEGSKYFLVGIVDSTHEMRSADSLVQSRTHAIPISRIPIEFAYVFERMEKGKEGSTHVSP